MPVYTKEEYDWKRDNRNRLRQKLHSEYSEKKIDNVIEIFLYYLQYKKMPKKTISTFSNPNINWKIVEENLGMPWNIKVL